ncbi:NAD(P)/FAD-dependent oxidoreductase [Streptomyces ureilyticus]|uniref:FAD-dependent oxidoreductase n=1 Tax=Streptomyces ureilyticus TaxID=1775131 RepID=A0ABX0DV64_9ACTN|nr:FAD-dependent oxidoreductase [Streptomyces ureilyticus]NGO45821.1 FAD-dependent oxidoreductase [Streptomyces ureilyticus]
MVDDESFKSTHGDIRYRPRLESAGSEALAAGLIELQPQFLLVNTVPPAPVLTAWRKSAPDDRRLLVLAAKEDPDRVQPTKMHGVEVALTSQHVTSEAAVELLSALEETWAAATKRRLPAPEPPPQPAALGAEGRVVLVGAGIVNLVTAAALLDGGWEVELIDAGPHPVSGAPWQSYGTTYGGDDARIFSLNETRNHHYRGLTESENLSYRRSVSDGGWLSRSLEDLNTEDRSWRAEFEGIPSWLRRKHDTEIIAFNQQSLPQWTEMMHRDPLLFSESGLRKRLYRAYGTDEQFRQGIEDEKSIGSFKRALTASELRDELPALGSAYARGHVRHVVEVVGFSVQVQRLAAGLIERIERRGGTFRWNHRVTAVRKNADGEVTGLEVSGDLVRARHYVFSPGASAEPHLLRSLGLASRIARVAGVWLTLPNVSPRLDWPLKVTRRGFASPGAVEGVNVVPGIDAAGRPVIRLGAGYGHLGTSQEPPSTGQLLLLSRALHETAGQLLPDAYAEAGVSPDAPTPPRFCVRPWTPSCLGIFHALAAERGGRCIVTGGHNSGGFAQAPSVASAVLAELRGRGHAMHTWYHPERTLEFLRLLGRNAATHVS